MWAPVDSTALSLWADRDWFMRGGGTVYACEGGAEAMDKDCLTVAGAGMVTLELWGQTFREQVRILNELADKILIGRRFWTEHKLRLDLARHELSIRVDGAINYGLVSKSSVSPEVHRVCRVLEGDNVDHHLQHETDYSKFSDDPRMQSRLKKRLWQKRDIFKGIGCIKGVKHRIVLKANVRPVGQPLCRRSPKEQAVEREAMGNLLERGVLEPNTSPWASNNVFVLKKDGSTRVTEDFRALNEATVTYCYPMEDMRQVLDWLASKKIYSTFDMKDALSQVKLEEEFKPLTAIRTVIGLLQYTMLPQGMKDLPGTLQCILNVVLGDRKGLDVLAFMDDASAGTESETEHLLALESLLDTLLQAGVRLKLSKCSFGVRSVKMFGHRVDNDGLSLSQAHVEAIGQLVEPGSGDELMRFLGIANFISDFVDHFAETAAPLYEVLKGTGFSKKRKHGQKLKIPDWHRRWRSKHREAWRNLKSTLGSPDILIAPIRGATKKVMTDASSYGLGAVLPRKNEHQKWRPVSFTSKLLKPSERKFTATEKECLAIVHELRKWRHYVHGETFEVVTDHLALRCLLSVKDPRERLARWAVEAQDFDFTVEHRAGKELVVPDTPSRHAVPKPLCQRCYCHISGESPESEVNQTDQNRINAALAEVKAEKIATVAEIRSFAHGLTREDIRLEQEKEFGNLSQVAAVDRKKFEDDEGLLRVEKGDNTLLVVPKSLRQAVLGFAHGSKLKGHYKVARTVAMLRKNYWWKEIVPDVVEFVNNCLHCVVSQEEQPKRQVGLEVVHPSRRVEQVAIDVQTITPRTRSGNIKILVMIDVFTQFVRAVPITDEKAETVAKVLLAEWIVVLGLMKKLMSEGGRNSVSKVGENLIAHLGVGRMQCYPWHCEG